MAEIEAPRRKVGITPLKSRRLSRGQTAREVAEATGLSKQWIVLWELGEKEIPPTAERTLARHYGVRVRDLRRFPDVTQPKLDLDKLAENVARRVMEYLKDE